MKYYGPVKSTHRIKRKYVHSFVSAHLRFSVNSFFFSKWVPKLRSSIFLDDQVMKTCHPRKTFFVLALRPVQSDPVPSIVKHCLSRGPQNLQWKFNLSIWKLAVAIQSPDAHYNISPITLMALSTQKSISAAAEFCFASFTIYFGALHQQVIRPQHWFLSYLISFALALLLFAITCLNRGSRYLLYSCWTISKFSCSYGGLPYRFCS